MALLMFAALFVLLLAGYPVALTLGGVALLFGLVAEGPDLFALMPLRIWGVMEGEILMAVPLFIYMGIMLEKAKIAEEMLETMAFLFGRLRGGMAISVVAVGMLLAASTGIVGATVVTMGVLSLPTMLKRGYSPELSTGTIAASGTLGQIIPPSIVLVLLGSILNVDIGSMFVGAVIPGLLLVGLYIVWIVVLAIFRPESTPAMPAAELAAFRKNLVSRVFWAFLAPLVLIVLVLGSIFLGITSPTEAAAVGATGATGLALLRRKFGWTMFKGVMKETTLTTCMVFIILVGARAFGLVFNVLGGPDLIVGTMQDTNVGPTGFLVIVMLMLFVAGFFIDFIEITFVIVPIVWKIAETAGMGINPLWLGILIALNLQTSFLTPPFGFSLFYLKGVAPPSVTTGHLYRGIIPYIVIQLVCLGLVIAIPDMALWLPEVMKPEVSP